MADLVYTAQSKRFFYCRDAVCEFVLRAGRVPLQPFKLFDYFLGDRVERDVVRRANDVLVTRSDQVWVFGTAIADGVLAEIGLAHAHGLPVRFFTIGATVGEIMSMAVDEVTFEPELVAAHGGNVGQLRAIVTGDVTHVVSR